MIDFLCIGAQKADTTWLMANLRSHPGVWTPPFAKELHYFDAVHFNMGKAWILGSYEKNGTKLFAEDPEGREYFMKVMDPGFAFTDAWYEHIFTPAPRSAKRGECTPAYSALDEAGVQHVARCSPQLRIIYIIRDPLDRMKSSMRMSLHRETVGNDDEISKLLDNRMFRARGDYAANIPRWEKHFPKEQILYIPFGDVRTNPESVMRQVEEHIGLSPHRGYPKLTDKVHRSKKKDFSFSDGLLEKMAVICRPQNDFLLQHFGADFAAKTK